MDVHMFSPRGHLPQVVLVVSSHAAFWNCVGFALHGNVLLEHAKVTFLDFPRCSWYTNRIQEHPGFREKDYCCCTLCRRSEPTRWKWFRDAEKVPTASPPPANYLECHLCCHHSLVA
ncbi:unnamed protein product, partial [Ectocarpus sp. 13 AM-2016]